MQRWLDVFAAAGTGGAAAPPAPPWIAWLVVALVVQHERQRWHREIVTTRIDPDGQEADDDGPVPGLPGWEFLRHGIGYCLLGPDGEQLDVDHHDDAAAVIDRWFFAARVASVAAADGWPAERRLWRWRPDRELVVDGFDELADTGAITWHARPALCTLAPALAERAAEVTADLAAPDAEARWRRALGDRDDDAQRAAHRTWLIERARTSPRRGTLLQAAVAAVPPEQGLALLREQVAGPAEHAAGSAVELLRGRPSWPACPEVVDLLRRIVPEDDSPYVGYQAIAYVLERGLAPAFARARFDELAAVRVARGFHGNPFAAELAILALRFLPNRAMPLVRRALRSTTPMCVSAITAVLAALGQPWCHRELAAALGRERAAELTTPPATSPDAELLRGAYPDDWTGEPL